MKISVAILISGNGSNMVHLVKSMDDGHPAFPSVVISNKIDAQDIILACDHASLHTLLPEIPKPTQARAVSTYYFTTPVIKSLAPLNLIQSKKQ